MTEPFAGYEGLLAQSLAAKALRCCTAVLLRSCDDCSRLCKMERCIVYTVVLLILAAAVVEHNSMIYGVQA
eukprot:SAG31_NODE_2687_length_5245_cov_1.854676_5_plen_71_part_00